jgi:hypothetical protein
VPSSKITTLSELQEYLYLAMQLEHATLPAYLTALYSITPGTNSDAVHVLRVIAVEEMLHLTIAANLLNAIGGKPDLTRAGFVPLYPTYLPDGETDFKVHVARFSQETIETFKQIERPRIAPKGHGKLVRRSYEPGTSVLAAHPGSTDMHFYSIGDFYEAIEEGFVYLEGQANAQGKTIFTGDLKRQVTAEYYYSGGGKLFAVHNLTTASAAIRLVMEQGEGKTGGIYDHENELSHYYRFDQLTKGQYYQPGDKAGDPTGPKFTVDWNASYPIKADVKLKDYPSRSELYAAALSFNEAYAKFLKALTRAYNGEPELLLGAVPKMFDFRNLIAELIRNPLPDSDGLYAAPTFEIDGAPAPTDKTAGVLEEVGA